MAKSYFNKPSGFNTDQKTAGEKERAALKKPVRSDGRKASAAKSLFSAPSQTGWETQDTPPVKDPSPETGRKLIVSTRTDSASTRTDSAPKESAFKKASKEDFSRRTDSGRTDRADEIRKTDAGPEKETAGGEKKTLVSSIHSASSDKKNEPADTPVQDRKENRKEEQLNPDQDKRSGGTSETSDRKKDDSAKKRSKKERVSKRKQPNHARMLLAVFCCIAALSVAAVAALVALLLRNNRCENAQGSASASPEMTGVSESTPTTSPEPSPEPEQETFRFGGTDIPVGATAVRISGDGFIRIRQEEVETLAAQCPDLSRLELERCWLDTYEPLYQLENLEYLQLRFCGDENGGVPLTEIGWVKQLKHLKHLDLSHNKIENVDGLSDLTCLQWLDLGDNRLSDSAVGEIAKLAALEHLYLYQNKLSDVSALRALVHVAVLDISQNAGITDVGDLTGMSGLVDLRLADTGVNDLSRFEEFKKLTTVDLSHCPLTKDDFIEHLTACKALKTVIVGVDDAEAAAAKAELAENESTLIFRER